MAKDKLAGEEEEDQEGGGDDDDEFEMPHFMQVEFNDLQKKLADKYVSSLFFFVVVTFLFFTRRIDI